MKSLMLAVSIACAFAAATPSRADAGAQPAQPKLEYVKKARAELEELSRKIDALSLKAKKDGASARQDIDQKITELKARRRTVSRDIAKLKRSSDQAWMNLKTGVDKGIAKLKKELKELDEAVKN